MCHQDPIPKGFQQRIQAAKEQKLEVLDLSNDWYSDDSQKLTYIPDEVFELTHLKVLILRLNKIQILPESISNLSELTRLDLGENQLTKLPESISKLSNLTRLDLWRNQLSKLPKSIGNLSNLITLFLNSNQLTKLPESISKLSNLTKLNLNKNQLSKLPESIGNLSNLIDFYLKSNQLNTLPESISDLSNLTGLDLSSNQLSKLPESIGDLSSLTTLFLSSNQLSILPESISKLSSLTTLDLWNNPLQNPPIEVANKGIEAIKEYFRQFKEGKDYIYEAKLLIIGEGSAGKTTLAKKIEDKNYQLDAHEKSTEGIDITKWSFPYNEREFKVNIWDFGGQEIYHATHQFFLTKRSLYVLVVDNRKEDDNLYYWLNVVELLSDNSPLLIIKNKKQDRHRELNERALRGQFTNLEKTLPTNLATNDGLDDVLKNIKHYISTLDHIGSALPKTWVKVRQALEDDDRNYISLDEYLQICQDNGFSQREDKLQLSGYLHDLGVCLHFQEKEDSLLYKTVILKPEWGTDAVYKVLDNPQVINNQGCFTSNDLKNIWHEDKYALMRGELLELMKKFQLCYEIPDSKDIFIAPQLLSENQPDCYWNPSNNLILRYTYPDFMPKGIISHFIVVMHQCIDGICGKQKANKQQYVWRSGVVLKKNNTSAEIIEYYGKREITIRVAGANRRDFMTIISHELDKINNTYKQLKYQKLIPCNCSECKSQQKLYFHPFDVLQKAKEKRQRQIQCQKSFQMVDVLNLIDDVIIQHNSEKLDSTLNLPQTTTNIEQHFHGNVGSATGTIETNQNSGDINMTSDRNIKIGQGNYNENIEGDYYENKNTYDSSRNLTISGGTINNTGAGSFNLGDISGTVANTINQLPSFDNEPNKQELKELLTQLQTAVLETDLDTEEQEESLEQITAIAESLQNPQDSAVKKIAKRAMKVLRGTAAALPPTASMVTICNQLPDLIGQIF